MAADATAAYYFNLEDECEKKNRVRRPRRFWIHDVISRRVVTVKSDFKRINNFYIGLVACFRHGGLVSGCSVPLAPIKPTKLAYSVVGPDSSLIFMKQKRDTIGQWVSDTVRQKVAFAYNYQVTHCLQTSYWVYNTVCISNSRQSVTTSILVEVICAGVCAFISDSH
jgi:ribosomal protein L19